MTILWCPCMEMEISTTIQLPVVCRYFFSRNLSYLMDCGQRKLIMLSSKRKKKRFDAYINIATWLYFVFTDILRRRKQQLIKSHFLEDKQKNGRLTNETWIDSTFIHMPHAWISSCEETQHCEYTWLFSICCKIALYIHIVITWIYLRFSKMCNQFYKNCQISTPALVHS